MSVYVDTLTPCLPNKHWPWRTSCHLYADELIELHEFAERLGLKRAWFQNRRWFPHYDLTGGKRRQAVAAGAIEHKRRDTFEVMNRWRRAYGQHRQT